MEYIWNTKELEEDRKKLTDLLNKDGIDKQLINFNLFKYDQMIALSKNSIDNIANCADGEKIVTLEELINKEADFLHDSKTKEYTELLIQALGNTCDINVPSFQRPKKWNKSNDVLVADTLEFFKRMTNKDMADKASKVLTPQNHILYIKGSTKCDNDFSANSTSGATIIDDITEKKHIWMESANNCYDLTILIHEIFHYIYRTSKNTKDNPLLSEVESTFSELLTIKYLEDYSLASKEDIIANKYFFLSECKTRAMNTIYKNGIIKMIIKDADSEMNLTKELWKILFKVPFSTEALAGYLKEFAEYDIIYSIGRLIAFDLFAIYQEDSDHAFKLVSNIVNENDSNVTSLLEKNDITFFKDGCKNMKKYYKKID